MFWIIFLFIIPVVAFGFREYFIELMKISIPTFIVLWILLQLVI